MENKQKVVFVGAGSMAEAMISGMLQKELFAPSQITVINRSNTERIDYLQMTYGIHTTQNKEITLKNADIMILAMKPKDVVEGVTNIREFVNSRQLIISVLAGVATTTITDLLQTKVAVIRAMPNTSATIGKSATALSVGKYATEEDLNIAHQLFTTIGIVTTVAEKDLHAVTGLSGSGPAYVYYLVEAMEKAADEIGLEKKIAKELILQTIIGAAEMLKTSTKQPAILRREVTSPGGTTEAGIKVLEQFHYQEAMISCIKRATTRSSELGEALTQSTASQD
ncbi:pyrroline-5-carboxylate reductase ProI [Fredinandcohnia quinoae]|uniref:Pyrroline-5-carboxylate reductase n=1 Tax=Fredinandcohnia quinoae TaxID=2918902 RepID=A0AAW5E5H8_9BACI|nr:pyrroline-5-carboxylate reductase ProI [Fredinandcohnia sp. SECRCQ15]MCH1624865.1 pyrroline-5-carboxylate reductase ProI [Fredinandcohnia sp. SECRCQ15]